MTVDITELTVVAPGGTKVLDQATFSVRPGRITALTGPSGAGKTILLRAVLGHLPPELSLVRGGVSVLGEDVFALGRDALRRLRRTHLALVGQDPGAQLNPTMRVGALLAEAARQKGTAAEVLERVRLPASYLRRRPGELSGGEQRRVALARALARETDVLLIDEPMAGLDVTLRREIAALLRSLADSGTAVAVSGHDLDLLNSLADSVTSLCPLGDGPAPLPPAAPARAAVEAADPALSGTGLGAAAGRSRILREVDFVAARDAATAIVGVSGAGKTTLARVLVGLHADCSGTLSFGGRTLARSSRRRSRDDRRAIQLIPQNPLSTLNPSRTVGAALSRPLALHGLLPRSSRAARVEALLADVGLASEFAARYPHELSGGQRQRVAIARALAAEPSVLVCDEITSALDPRTAESIMDLLASVRADRGLSLVVISHDLGLVARHCSAVYVLHGGQVVESGPTETVFTRPTHPVTTSLVNALP
jgi:peptide/nickel transport system ATP-binding protein